MKPQVGSGRLLAWAGLVGALSFLAYAGRAAGGKPPEDFLYQYSAALGGLLQYAFILGVVLLIGLGQPKRELLALRRPVSWKLSGALALGILFGVAILSGVLGHFVDAGEEQGLTPEHWRPDRAAPFAANFVVVAGVAPVVEELTFRGLGFSLVLERFGGAIAIAVTSVAFGLAHGLLAGLPILVAFGVGLAYLRSRTESIYPAMILHAAFNAIALTYAVAV